MSIQTPVRWRLWTHATTLTLAGTVACVSGEKDPTPRPALEYVVRAFDRYPLVALSEWHGSRETKDFVSGLIRHTGFAGAVADIVVEFGNARYQRVIDRYIGGDEVAREDFKQVWETTTRGLRMRRAQIPLIAITPIVLFEHIVLPCRRVFTSRAFAPTGRINGLIGELGEVCPFPSSLGVRDGPDVGPIDQSFLAFVGSSSA